MLQPSSPDSRPSRPRSIVAVWAIVVVALLGACSAAGEGDASQPTTTTTEAPGEETVETTTTTDPESLPSTTTTTTSTESDITEVDTTTTTTEPEIHEGRDRLLLAGTPAIEGALEELLGVAELIGSDLVVVTELVGVGAGIDDLCAGRVLVVASTRELTSVEQSSCDGQGVEVAQVRISDGVEGGLWLILDRSELPANDLLVELVDLFLSDAGQDALDSVATQPLREADLAESRSRWEDIARGR